MLSPRSGRSIAVFVRKEMQRSFAEFTLSPFDFAQGRSQIEGERAQDDMVGARAFNISQAFALLRGAVENHADFLERDEPSFNHFIQSGKDLFNPLGILDRLNHDRQVLRKAQNVRSVVKTPPTAAGAITAHSAQNRDA